VSDPFSDKLAAWQEYVATPWGRIRYAVVAETLRRQAAELLALELGLCDREPFCRVGGMWQLVFEKTGANR